MAIFDSISETHRALTDVGYITDEATAGIVFFCAEHNKPLLIEGPAGAGKTQLALSVAKAGNRPFIRLQCYQGLTDKQAIGAFSEPLQKLFSERTDRLAIDSRSEKMRPFEDLALEMNRRPFFNGGPLLDALESEIPAVLLIDEIDKTDYAFEALLLQMLETWEITVTQLGLVRAKTIPFVVITSNAERPLGFALRRRCNFTEVEHPTAEREAEIVARKTPHCDPAMHRFIAGLAIALRKESLEKPPSISEMNSVAMALETLGLTEIRPEQKLLFLPMLAKTKDDRRQLINKTGMFEKILEDAKVYAAAMTDSQVDLLSRGNGDSKELPAFTEKLIAKDPEDACLPEDAIPSDTSIGAMIERGPFTESEAAFV